ncbi:MAG: rhodanese-like domain-containing protein [Candidatus Omnitrophica bacterium]|nr:rhodanese-like domain-containing protein [Candidatus Omnitrophota bacterium]MBI3009682.1 rhodanese-like domain-containing protein [Candidatus Omnitrophota bacterium]
MRSLPNWLMLSAGFAAFLFCPRISTAEGTSSEQASYVSSAEVQEWFAQGKSVHFLDVREKDEFEAGHIAGAINIPYDQVRELIPQLSKNDPIVVYCIHSAHRAPEAAKTLKHEGFENVYVLEGGIVGWQAGGLSIQASDLAKTPTVLPKTERCAFGEKKGTL